MRQEQAITLFLPGSGRLHFIIGAKTKEYAHDGNVEHITAYGDGIDIDFESGRHLSINGIPYIYDSYQPPDKVPF